MVPAIHRQGHGNIQQLLVGQEDSKPLIHISRLPSGHTWEGASLPSGKLDTGKMDDGVAVPLQAVAFPLETSSPW